MLLEEMGVSKRTITALHKKNVFSSTDLVRTFPRKYLDYRNVYSLQKAQDKDCAICGYVESVGKKNNGNISYITIDAIDGDTGIKFHVKWYGKSFLWESIQKLVFKEVVFCGKVSYDVIYGYNILNPYTYQLKEQYNGKIVPVYPNMKGVSEDMLKKLINESMTLEKEPLSEIVLQKTKLMRYEEALRCIHHPQNLEDIDKAKKRIIFNDMLYFCIRMKKNHKQHKKESQYIVRETETTEQFIANRPFKLTVDQQKTVDTFIQYMKAGKRINGLVQGDVGCGKTMIAIISMFLMAENGYQSVIMAPTTVLAKQHYLEVLQYANEFGYEVAFLSSEIKGKEKTQTLKRIKSGEANLIVGTHSVMSKNVMYNNIGLVITDEEHRFGVAQRESLEQKASEGAHVITMSATPIPRTMADILYGEDKELFTIESMPDGRTPIQTAINNSDEVIKTFIRKQLEQDHQAYVVCPLIEEKEESQEKEQEPLVSVEQALAEYRMYFTPLGYTVGMVNGKMPKEESEAIIQKFKNKEIQILVSTTVIEVGVNVPNANVMVIENAERFGLPQLHQLRGRVGRGKAKSYCILKSKHKDNERLQTMERTTNGFEIAQADLQLRGIGDLIGTQQSGSNYYASLILAMPNLYKCVKKYADWIITDKKDEPVIHLYEVAAEENVA